MVWVILRRKLCRYHPALRKSGERVISFNCPWYNHSVFKNNNTQGVSHILVKDKKKNQKKNPVINNDYTWRNKTIFITTADLRYVKSHSDEAHTLASTSAIYALNRLSQIGFVLLTRVSCADQRFPFFYMISVKTAGPCRAACKYVNISNR